MSRVVVRLSDAAEMIKKNKPFRVRASRRAQMLMEIDDSFRGLDEVGAQEWYSRVKGLLVDPDFGELPKGEYFDQLWTALDERRVEYLAISYFTPIGWRLKYQRLGQHTYGAVHVMPPYRYDSLTTREHQAILKGGFDNKEGPYYGDFPTTKRVIRSSDTYIGRPGF